MDDPRLSWIAIFMRLCRKYTGCVVLILSGGLLCGQLSAQPAPPIFAVQSSREITESTGPASTVVSSTGDIYMAGAAEWFDWPVPTNSIGDASKVGTAVAKLDLSGKPLYVTSIGGAFLRYLALDGSGGLYVYGLASPSTFTVTPGSYHSSQGNTFTCKLRTTDGEILFCALFDGSVTSFTVDSAGAIYFAGGAPEGIGPTPGAYSYGNRIMAVTKIDATGSQVLWRAEFSGSNLNDTPISLAIDSQGNVWVGGSAYSKDFPTTPDAVFSEFPSASGFVFPTTGFLAELNAPGTSLLYSTFTGALETFVAMSRDPVGNTYALTVHNGLLRLRKIDPTGKTIQYDRSLSGVTVYGSSLAVDDVGVLTLLGQTQEVNFPTYHSAHNCGFTEFSPGLSDGVLIRIGANGDLLESTFLGLGGSVSVSLEPWKLSVQTGRIFALLWSEINPDVLAPDAVVGPHHLHFLQLEPDQNAGEGLKLACVGSAATLTSAPFVRGEIISLFGDGIGPDQAANLQLDASGRVANVLANTQVFFDGIPAPLLYAQSRQINAIVPWGIQGGMTTEICVVYLGQKTNCIEAPVSQVSPGFFRIPSGTIAALNEDSTVNTIDNPAKPGSIVTLFVTGTGPSIPPQSDGEVTQGVHSSALALEVDFLSIGGGNQGNQVPIEVVFHGPAPTLVSGVEVIQVRVPPGLTFSVQLSIRSLMGGPFADTAAIRLVSH